MKVTNDILYVGVNDHVIDLFEGQYVVPNGMSYNSYVILDDKIAVMDTVDGNFTDEWMTNIAAALGDRQPDYLIVQHMEPDHSANILNFLNQYPKAVIVGNPRTFVMVKNFFEGINLTDRQLIVNEGDTLNLGSHELSFVMAPMIHWPEVMMTYDTKDKVLFTADAFGKFGALDAEDDWADEARRYYIGIVGKYGTQVQSLLKKASALDIELIAPLHGPVLKDDLDYYMNLYDLWSSYTPEKDGVVIAYTSIYGNTKKAVELLAQQLREKGAMVIVHDLARTDWALATADAFKYSKLVLATTTYNGNIFPFMKQYIDHLTERGFKNRTVGLIENGSWAPIAGNIMKKMLENSKDIRWLNNSVRIFSSVHEENLNQITAMAEELTT